MLELYICVGKRRKEVNYRDQRLSTENDNDTRRS